ncbi:MAG: sporulation protein [Oscillospiraceae bacterium]|nr:sporulation protein [Oscillospiraceae bacterium]
MKETFLERAARKLDVPAELTANVPKIIIHGYREIYIENHQGLLEYGTREVHINGGEAVLKLSGEGFHIRAMTANELRLEGLIFKVEFIF